MNINAVACNLKTRDGTDDINLFMLDDDGGIIGDPFQVSDWFDSSSLRGCELQFVNVEFIDCDSGNDEAEEVKGTLKITEYYKAVINDISGSEVTASQMMVRGHFENVIGDFYKQFKKICIQDDIYLN